MPAASVAVMAMVKPAVCLAMAMEYVPSKPAVTFPISWSLTFATTVAPDSVLPVMTTSFWGGVELCVSYVELVSSFVEFSSNFVEKTLIYVEFRFIPS